MANTSQDMSEVTRRVKHIRPSREHLSLDWLPSALSLVGSGKVQRIEHVMLEIERCSSSRSNTYQYAHNLPVKFVKRPEERE